MPRVKQALFEMTTESGSELTFAVMDDDRCAILRNGDIEHILPTDDASLGRAVRQYFKMVEGGGGARHPFHAMDEVTHPHAG